MKPGQTQSLLKLELLAECLFRANRFDELEHLDCPTPRGRFWQGAGYARQGRLEETLAAWREVSARQLEFQPVRRALATLLRRMAFRHAKDADWEAASLALAESRQVAGELSNLDSVPVAEALLFLLAGRRQDAIRTLEEALRQDPTNGIVVHALGLACYHTARDLEEHGQMQEAARAWERVIAAWVMLTHHDEFWKKWQSETEARYQVDLSKQALEEVRKQVEAHLEAILSGGFERDPEEGADNQPHQLPERSMLVRRELKAADLLVTWGGFQLPGQSNDRLVCGPLMIQFLGLERAFGEFVSALPVRKERHTDRVMTLLGMLLGQEVGLPDGHLPDPAQKKRLRRYFSQLGVAQVLLDLDRPREALTALAGAGCSRCRALVWRSERPHTTHDWFPFVCAETCPDFDTLNPGYVGLQDKGRHIWGDALDLAVEAWLNLAQSCLAAGTMDAQALAAHWQEAIRLSRVSDHQEQTQLRIVEMTLGRVRALEQKARFDVAIALLEAAEAICGDYVDQEIVGRLAEILTHRGIFAGNETPPRWEAAVADLRRAVRYNPHAPRPVVNLGIALRGWAAQRYEHGQCGSAVNLLQEAVRQLQEGVSHIPGHVELERQYQDAQNDLRYVLNAYSAHLLRIGQIEQASAVLEQGLQWFPEDPTMTRNLAQVRLMMGLSGERRW